MRSEPSKTTLPTVVQVTIPISSFQPVTCARDKTMIMFDESSIWFICSCFCVQEMKFQSTHEGLKCMQYPPFYFSKARTTDRTRLLNLAPFGHVFTHKQ